MRKIRVIAAIFVLIFILGIVAVRFGAPSILAQENNAVTINKTVVSTNDDSEDKYRNAGLAATPIIPVFPSQEKG